MLQPDHPLPLHKLLFTAAYAGWDEAARGPPPAWVPTPEGMAATNAAAFMRSWRGTEAWRQLRSGDPGADWELLQRLSWAAPEAFWPHLLARLRVRFHRLPHRVLEAGPDPDSCRWLPGARLNVAESALTGVWGVVLAELNCMLAALVPTPPAHHALQAATRQRQPSCGRTRWPQHSCTPSAGASWRCRAPTWRTRCGLRASGQVRRLSAAAASGKRVATMPPAWTYGLLCCRTLLGTLQHR